MHARKLRVLEMGHGMDGHVEVFCAQSLGASRTVVAVGLRRGRHRLVNRSHDGACRVELRRPYTLMTHVRCIQKYMMGRVLWRLVLRHHRSTIWGKAMVRIVARFVDHTRGRRRSRLLHRMSVRPLVWIVRLTRGVVALVALALTLVLALLG